MSANTKNDQTPPSSHIPETILPHGTIIQWHGELGGIPQGWNLCDGTQGTPDLRCRFEFPHNKSALSAGKAIVFLQLNSNPVPQSQFEASSAAVAPIPFHSENARNSDGDEAFISSANGLSNSLRRNPTSPEISEADVESPVSSSDSEPVSDSEPASVPKKSSLDQALRSQLVSGPWNICTKSTGEGLLNLTASPLRQGTTVEIARTAEGLDSEWRFDEVEDGIFTIQNVLRSIQFPSTSYLSVAGPAANSLTLSGSSNTDANQWIVQQTSEFGFRLLSRRQAQAGQNVALHCVTDDIEMHLKFIATQSASTLQIQQPPDFYE